MVTKRATNEGQTFLEFFYLFIYGWCTCFLVLQKCVWVCVGWMWVCVVWIFLWLEVCETFFSLCFPTGIQHRPEWVRKAWTVCKEWPHFISWKVNGRFCPPEGDISVFHTRCGFLNDYFIIICVSLFLTHSPCFEHKKKSLRVIYSEVYIKCVIFLNRSVTGCTSWSSS